MIEDNNINDQTTVNYDEGNIQTLTGLEHIRLRPGMYIGRLGDGSSPEDGIYVLLKEVFDNSIDEFKMKAGDRIEVNVEDNHRISVRDYGRGIPLEALSDAVSKMNTGGKYGGDAFKKTVGLNGVGVKAVNMLSSHFLARSVRNGEARTVTFSQGIELSDRSESGVSEANGTYVEFVVDREVFGEYSYNLE
jgi:topoisomerase-4 subunit B